MAVTISKEALKQMEVALAAVQEDANPFVRDGDTTFIRFEEMRLIQQRPGLVAVEFLWRGAIRHTMHVDCDLAAGQLLTLTGVEIRVAVRAF